MNEDSRIMPVFIAALITLAIMAMGMMNGHDIAQCEKTHATEVCHATFNP